MTSHQCAPRQTAQRTKAVRINKAAMATTDKAATARAPLDPVSLVMISPDEVCGDLARLSPPRAHVGASLASIEYPRGASGTAREAPSLRMADQDLRSRPALPSTSETPSPTAVAPPRDGVSAAAIAGGIRAVAAAFSPTGAEGTRGNFSA